MRLKSKRDYFPENNTFLWKNKSGFKSKNYYLTEKVKK